MTADVDFDGKVSVEEFDGMIEAAAALPRLIFFSFFWRGGRRLSSLKLNQHDY